MVDFAIYLQRDEPMMKAMRALAAREPNDAFSVNQTWHTPLLSRPIGVTIETKRTGDGWDAALLQSGTWVAAQLARLEQLVGRLEGDLDSIPFLPIIVIQGHDWHLLAASRGENGQTVSKTFTSPLSRPFSPCVFYRHGSARSARALIRFGVLSSVSGTWTPASAKRRSVAASIRSSRRYSTLRTGPRPCTNLGS